MTTYTLISAASGDAVPGVEISDPECPLRWPEDIPEHVQEWMEAQGWGEEDPHELLYVLVDGEDPRPDAEDRELPDGFERISWTEFPDRPAGRRIPGNLDGLQSVGEIGWPGGPEESLETRVYRRCADGALVVDDVFWHASSEPQNLEGMDLPSEVMVECTPDALRQHLHGKLREICNPDSRNEAATQVNQVMHRLGLLLPPITQLRNLTPHTVHLHADGQVMEIPPDAATSPPRVSTASVPTEPVTVNGASVPVVVTGLGALEGLPDWQPGVGLIVSRVVAEAAPHRQDLLVPHDLVRDDAGRVVGCRALGQVPAP